MEVEERLTPLARDDDFEFAARVGAIVGVRYRLKMFTTIDDQNDSGINDRIMQP